MGCRISPVTIGEVIKVATMSGHELALSLRSLPTDLSVTLCT